MTDVWEFRNARVKVGAKYSDGTIVPEIEADLFKNDRHVGEVNVHMHKRKGPDGRVDTSFGATHIVFGEAEGGS